jgi:hypothetical protein
MHYGLLPKQGMMIAYGRWQVQSTIDHGQLGECGFMLKKSSKISILRLNV